MNSNTGSFGSTTSIPVITVNGKGLITAVSTAGLGSIAVQAANSVNITGGTITGIGAATNPSDVTILSQVQSLIATGVHTYSEVNATFSTNVTIATPGSLSDGSFSVISGNRVLLTGQTSGSQNGPWVYNGSAVPMTRPIDYAAASSQTAGLVYLVVGAGSTKQDYQYILNTSSVTVDVTITSWGTFSAAITGTAPINVTGGVVSINAAGIGNSLLTNSSITIAGHSVSLGGTQTLAASDLTNGTTGTGSIVLAAGPALTGVPTAPTASAATNTTQIATTAFVTGGMTIAAYTYLGNSTSSSAVASGNTVLTLGTPSGTFSAAVGSVLGQFSSNTNQYSQLCVQNLNSGSSASSDFVATADTGTDSSKYLDIGINNSTGAATPFAAALACYMYTDQAELDIGALGTSGIVNIYASGGTTTPTKAVAFSGTASTFSGQIASAVAGTASTSPVSITGTPFSGTGTTSFPLVYLAQSTATASTTLNTAGTFLGINSHGTQDFANFMIDGVQKAKIDYLGQYWATNFKTTGSGGIVQTGYINNGDGSYTMLTCLAGSTALFMNGATNPFLTFGASTSSGVGLRRSATTLACVLGDNSADAAFTCGAFTSTVPNITTTSTDGIVLQNNTASTVGVQTQYSPRFRQSSRAWNTTTPADNILDFYSEVEPTAGATPSALWYLKSVVAGSTTTCFSVNNFGSLTVGNNLVQNGPNYTINNTAGLFNINSDTYCGRGGAAATWRFGNVDAASTVAQTLQVQSIVAGTSNTAGSDWTFIGSKPTGTGTPGNQILSNSFAGVSATTTVTLTIASPCVVTWTAHGFVPGQPFVFTTTGALPTGVAASTTYYVISTGISTNAFQFSATPNGAAINATGSQSGTQTGTTSTTVQNPATTIATWGPSGLAGSATTPLLNLLQTWNTSGGPTAIKLNVTNIASTSGKLIDLQVGGSSKIAVDTTGLITNATISASQLTSGTLAAGVGFSATTNDLGTITSGTVTPAAVNGNFQKLNANGAFTLAPPSTVCDICVEVTNGASAGTITTSGFSKVVGDTYATTNTNVYHFNIRKTANKSILSITACQ